ncbi:MAG: hypothetical protein HYZ29_16835 [Myxococcales bacterium]|nr:hypothetical protein [Myxococcales bacterium]
MSGVADTTGARSLEAGEQLVLAGLLRLLVRLDGKFSDEEQAALEELASDFGEKTFWQLMDEAGRKLPDETAIRERVGLVRGEEARTLIYKLVLEVARADCIQGREQGLLDWLREVWKLDETGSPYR